MIGCFSKCHKCEYIIHQSPLLALWNIKCLNLFKKYDKRRMNVQSVRARSHTVLPRYWLRCRSWHLTIHDWEDDEVNLLAYQLTHRDMHMAWIFAHPMMKGFSIVHSACVSIFIPIAPLKEKRWRKNMDKVWSAHDVILDLSTDAMSPQAPAHCFSWG